MIAKRKQTEVFNIKNIQHAAYWQQQAYPVMLVNRTSDGSIRWMDINAYLKEHNKKGKIIEKKIVFHGEPFTALTLQRQRDMLIPPPL